MISFKKYLEESFKKKKNKKDSIMDIARGPEFAMAGAGKGGLMQADKKAFKKRKQRKEGKDQAKRAMRGDY